MKIIRDSIKRNKHWNSLPWATWQNSWRGQWPGSCNLHASVLEVETNIPVRRRGIIQVRSHVSHSGLKSARWNIAEKVLDLSGTMIGHLNDKMALLSFAHRFRPNQSPSFTGFWCPPAPFLAPFQAFAPASSHLPFGAKVVPVAISQNWKQKSNTSISRLQFWMSACFSVDIFFLWMEQTEPVVMQSLAARRENLAGNSRRSPRYTGWGMGIQQNLHDRIK